MSAALDPTSDLPTLLQRWLAARSLVRGLPAPVFDRGGLRVDSGLPDELRRYLFAAPSAQLEDLLAAIRTPRIFVKLCVPGEQLLAMAGPRWRLQPRAWLMTQAGAPRAAVALDPAYRIDVVKQGAVSAATIHAPGGELAASGHAVEHGGVFVFDRIRTHPDHRRRGLGRALMAALGAQQESGAAQRVLTATDEGRALYATLGWTVVAPYSTVVIPDA